MAGPRTNTPAEAAIRGTLELAREERLALAVRACVQPNPALGDGWVDRILSYADQQ